MKNRKKFAFILLILALTLLLALPVGAEETVTLRLDHHPGDAAAAGVRFSLYRTADIRSGRLCPGEAYAGYFPEEPDEDDYRVLATTLSGVIAAGKISPTAEAETDEDGFAVFPGLQPGLYLVTGESVTAGDAVYAVEPWLVAVTEDTLSATKTVRYEKDEKITLRVRKLWSDADSVSHREDAVTVDLYRNGELYDRKTLSAATGWQAEWVGLEAAAGWSVTESDGPSGYTPSVERVENDFYITNTGTPQEEKPAEKLPQSGVLLWPVPCLTVAGVLCLWIGLRKRSRHREK